MEVASYLECSSGNFHPTAVVVVVAEFVAEFVAVAAVVEIALSCVVNSGQYYAVERCDRCSC